MSTESFVVLNGVKQGGISSHILFCLYNYALLTRLHHSGVGYYMDDVYLGFLAYADDITWVVPTADATKKNVTDI